MVLIEPGDVFEGKPYPPISLLTLVAAMSGRDDVACEIVDYRIGQTVDAFIPIRPWSHSASPPAPGTAWRPPCPSPGRSRPGGRTHPSSGAAPAHVTCVPDEAAREPFVDIVVRGDGEEALGEVITALVRGGALDTVRGILFKRHDRGCSTPGREPANLGRLPPSFQSSTWSPGTRGTSSG